MNENFLIIYILDIDLPLKNTLNSDPQIQMIVENPSLSVIWKAGWLKVLLSNPDL